MTRTRAITVFKAISYIGVYGGLLMPLVFIPVVIFPFVFSKLLAFQILVGLTFPAYLALAWMEPRYRPPRSALYTAIVAYFIALALSAVFSVDPLRSWWGNQERMNGLYTLLHLFAWLTMAVGLLKGWTDWRRLLNYEVCLSVVMASVALLQKVYPNLLLFPANERVGGLLDNPIYMGAYQIFNLFFLALLFLKTSSKRARVLYVVAAIFDVAAFAAAQSRGALLGLAAGIAVLALYYGVFTPNRRAKLGILGAGAAAFLAYGVLFLLRDMPFVLSNSILNRFTHFTSATATRFIAWDIAWKGFLERPLTGWGFDTFHILFNLKYNPRSLEFGYYETWFDRAHNTILDVLSMTGIFGFVTWAAIFATIFYMVWRARKRGWIDLSIASVLTALPVAYFVQNLFVFDHPAAFSMSYLMYALIIAATRPEFVGQRDESATVPVGGGGTGKSSGSAQLDTRAAPWTAFTVVQIIMLIVVWRFSVLPFKASYLSIRANMLRGRSLAESWAVMKQAGDIPTPYLDEQTFLLSRDIIAMASGGNFTSFPQWREMYEHAKKLSEKHISEHPNNTHPHFIYARMVQEVLPLLPPAEQAAEAALSEREYRTAIKTSPKRQQLYYSLGRLYSQLNRREESLDALKQALEFNKNVGESWWYVGVTEWFDFNRVDEGATAVLEAFKARGPYQMHTVREALILARAASLKNDPGTLKRIVPMLPSLSGGSIGLYMDIARIMERAGLIQERNMILNALQQIDPSVKPKLEALRNGTATSIDDSIAKTPIIMQINPPKDEAPTAAATSTAIVATTTASNGVRGPRR